VQHKDLHFTLNEELNNQITYLDLNLINKQGQIEMEVYRMPTTRDVRINKKSCHPKEHKLSAYRNWIHRLRALPLSKTNKQRELNAILNIASNNGYKKEDIIHLYNKSKYNKKKTSRSTTLTRKKSGSLSHILGTIYAKLQTYLKILI
jgi:hypothetical protein